MASCRLLIDPPLPGAVNMARDEALLQSCVDAGAPPVLRFYAWSPPTISLGYFQDYAEFALVPPPAGGLAVVRRTTGGGAILHDLELTYSIVIPLAHPLVAGRPNRLYELAHQAIIGAIGRGVRLLGCAVAQPPSAVNCPTSTQRGPFFCFARRHGLDVVVDDAGDIHGVSKIAGSAQRRTHTAILQHGSIMLDSRYLQQPAATWSRLAGGRVAFAEAAEALAPAFERQLETQFEMGGWQREELDGAAAHTLRYAGADWTVRRRRDPQPPK
jgi:lipoate-protein ligase A